MTHIRPQEIKIEDFNYDLPEAYIAQIPLEHRAKSKLLVYRAGQIEHDRFSNIGNHLPPSTLLVFNNTKVIPARLFFTKTTGAVIQIFLLEPVQPYNNMEQALGNQTGHCVWECMVGNAKKWKDEVLNITAYTGQDAYEVEATLLQREPFQVQFKWAVGKAFSTVIEDVGKMPLPPYIHRSAEAKDETSYQTVYAKHKGAVAAPTAGLHFTPELLKSLQQSGVDMAELTLHVGAGTFKPVDAALAWNHDMHAEVYHIKRQTLIELMESKFRIAVGTTSLRSMESLYWCGVNIANQQADPFTITQHQPYSNQQPEMGYVESLEHVVNWMDRKKMTAIYGSTSIMIMPGYDIKSVRAIITNFHMPQSTLLLLISTMIGDSWREVYEEAKRNNYRFLSYGDSSLLFISNNESELKDA